MPTTTAPKDALLQLLEDVQVNRTRMQKTTYDNPQAVATELNETAMSIVLELAGYVYELRNKTVQVTTDMDERLADVEEAAAGLGGSEGTQLEPEDAERFRALAEAAKWMAEALSQAAPPEGQKQLKEVIALAAECLGIIDESVLEDEDDDDDEDEEEDKAPQAGRAARGPTQ
jgi:hypothetical protein